MVKPRFVHLINATLVRPNPDRDKITFAGTSLLETNKGLEVIDQASPDQRPRRELNSFITASMGFISAIYHALLAYLHKKNGPACTNHQNGRRTDRQGLKTAGHAHYNSGVLPAIRFSKWRTTNEHNEDCCLDLSHDGRHRNGVMILMKRSTQRP